MKTQRQLIEEMMAELVERGKWLAEFIWDHKEYDGDGYFPISKKKAEERMESFIRHTMSSLLDADIQEMEGGYDEAVKNLRSILGRNPTDEEVAAMSIARSHLIQKKKDLREFLRELLSNEK